MSKQEQSKRDKILESVVETPCKPASDIAEEIGASPRIVGRVIEQNVEEDLQKMRETRMKKHVDDLGGTEQDLLWIVANCPGATQEDILEAYPLSNSSSTIREGESPGDVWRDVVDSEWQGTRKALAGDLRDLLDEDRVSDAAKQAVETLEEGDLEETDKETTPPSEGTARYMAAEIAEEFGDEDCAELIKQRRKARLRKDVLRDVADALGARVDEDATSQDLRESIAESVEGSTTRDGRLGKEVLEAIHDEVVSDDHECEYCGETFENEDGHREHETHCGENPDAEPVDGTSRSDGALTPAARETVEAIVENEITDLDALVHELSISYTAVLSRLNMIRTQGFDLYSEDLLEDARGILNEIGDAENDGHVCQYCGDSFETAAGLGKHEKHCNGDDTEEEGGADDAPDELPDRLEQALAVFLENPDAKLNDVSRAVYTIRDTPRKGFNSELCYHDLPLDEGDVREFAREYFEHYDKPDVSDVDVEARGTDLDDLLDDQEEGDVDLQETPTERDIEQADEAAEQVTETVAGEDEDETPHVKNEDGVDLERAAEHLLRAAKVVANVEAVHVYEEGGETKFDAEGMVLEEA